MQSAHDCSEGGFLVAAAEMTFGGSLGLALHMEEGMELAPWCFAESPSRYLLEVRQEDLDALRSLLGETSHTVVGTFDETHSLTLGDHSWAIEELEQAWSQGMAI